MPATMRQYRPCVMQRLLDRPQGFHFIQAVRLLEICLLQRGIMRSEILARHIRFRNSLSLSFAASDLEMLAVDGVTWLAGSAPPAGEVLGTLQQVCLTPAFFSLLGAQGALPLHYTDRIAVQLHDSGDDGTRAFFDYLSHRSVALFYLGWLRGRVEHLADAQGNDGYLPLQLALAGRAHLAQASGDGEEGNCGEGHCAGGAVHYDAMRHDRNLAAAHYAALLRGRDMPAAVIGQILSAYFNQHMQVEQFTGEWESLAPDEQASLGVANCTLGAGCILGRRYRRRDNQADIVIGPLGKADFRRFMPDAECAQALQAMAGQFSIGTVRFRVRVILRAQEIRRITLRGAGHPDRYRLGWDTFLVTQPSLADREMLYMFPGG